MRPKNCYAWIIASITVAGTNWSAAARVSSKVVAPTHSSPATCATATLNYITHSLPQQCLRTNRPTVSKDGSSATSAAAVPTKSRDVSHADSAVQSGPSQFSSLSSGDGDGLATSASTSSATSISASSDASPSPEAESEADSPLNDAKFLSFEDWMKQNLGATGQSAEAIARAKGQAETVQDRKRPGNTLDTLGEDSEISFEFDGFGGGIREAAQARHTTRTGAKSTGDAANGAGSSGPSGARSKDAGKTCKERFNYASFDCAANVLKTNPRCKSSSSVLVENKDSYMLNECAMDNKFLIVELCDHIQIDTIVFANFEFFSSMFRTFRISVSDRYPVKIDKWRVLGTYEARNSREIQAFLVENPMIWARYLRVEFLTHYGSEFYCPLSLLRVHGTTMMEDYRHTEALARGEAGDDDEEVGEVLPTPVVSDHAGAPDAIMTPIDVKRSLRETSTVQIVKAIVSTREEVAPSSSAPAATSFISGSATISSRTDTCSTCGAIAGLHSLVDLQSCPKSIASPMTSTAIMPPPPPTSSDQTRSSSSKDTTKVDVGEASPAVATSVPIVTSNSTSVVLKSSSSSAQASSSAPQSPSQATGSSSLPPSIRHSKANDTASAVDMTSNATNGSSTGASSSTSVRSETASASTILPIMAIPPPPTPSQPATQESFFKTLSKRLTALESNASLSLQYIESQSSLLRSAFAATSVQQLNKTAVFLAQLNATVLKELAAARSDYDQLWQSTVLELADQRSEGRRERELLGERVRLLAEEVVSTKRLMAAQAALLVLVLGVVVFSRAAPLHHGDGVGGGSVDLRLMSSVQGLMQRGRSGLRRVGSRSTLKMPTAIGRDSNHLAPPGALPDDEGHLAPRRWQWDSTTPGASPDISRGQSRPGTAGSDVSSTGNDAHVQHHHRGAHSRNVSGGEFPRSPVRLNKPLPIAPFDGTSSSREDDEAHLRHDYVRDNHDDYQTAPEPTSTALPEPLVLADRRTAALRGTRSAPATPRTSSPPPPALRGLPTPEGSGSESEHDQFQGDEQLDRRFLTATPAQEQSQDSPTWQRVESKRSRRRSRGKSGGREMRDAG